MPYARAIHSVAALLALAGHVWAPTNPTKAGEPAAPPPASPIPAEESLAYFQLAAGLGIELAASEPDVIDPVAARFDEGGRLWVVEMRDDPNGPAGDEPPKRVTPQLSRATGAELVEALGRKNAWWRQTAARLLYERQDIDQIHSNGISLMPDGLVRNIPLQEMADLISFIKHWRYLD